MRPGAPERLTLPLLLPFVLATKLALAQEPLPLLDGYHVRAFTVADGLPASDVRALAQDGNGYLYAAGGRGIARFDGERFTEVRLPESFETDLVDRLARDPSGRIWVITRSGDAGWVDGDRVRAVPRAGMRMSTVGFSADGVAWFGTAHGLVRVDPDDRGPPLVHGRAHGLPSDSITVVVRAPDGGVLIGTEGGLARMVSADPARFERVTVKGAPDRWYNAGPAEDSAIWLVGPDGLLRYGFEGAAVYDAADGLKLDLRLLAAAAPGSVVPHAMARRFQTPIPDGADNGHILLASDGGRWFAWNSPDNRDPHLLRSRTGQFQRIDLDQRLDIRSIRTMLEDHEGSLWLGSARGLLQIARRRVAGLGRRHGVAELFTTAVLQDHDGAVWIGSWGGGLHRFADGELDRRFTTTDGLPSNLVRALHQASDGQLWIGTHAGFAAYHRGRFRTWAARSVAAFTEGAAADGGPMLWVGGERFLLRSVRGSGFESFRPDIDWGQVWALHAARDGTVWVGSDTGLYSIVGNSVRHLTAPDGFDSGYVVSIHEEEDGTLWIGTYADGLYRLRRGRFARISSEHGLPHDGVWRILDDDTGGFWMSSDGGVFRIDRDRLHDVATALEQGRPPAPLQPLAFTEMDGMPSRECNRASPAGWRLRDGRLLFNNMAGAVVIEPSAATESPSPPPMVIQNVTADGQAIEWRATAPPRLPAGVRHLEIDFAALVFASPARNRYRYRLDGFDREWVSTRVARAVYTRLPPGRYTFRAAGATVGGPWAEEEATLALVVPPSYWQTGWFRSLALFAVVAVLYLAHRYRVARLLELERFRLRVAADLHDDVGSSLSSIALLSEMIARDGHVGRTARRQLERIREAASDTISSLREIIWLVDPAHDNLRDLVARMRRTAADLSDGASLEFRQPHPLPDRRLPPSFLRQTFLIYKEALHNLARHAGAERVVVEVDVRGDELRVRIVDDGTGFDAAAVEAGYGLASMRRRAAEIGADLHVSGGAPRGTRVEFVAPMA